MGKLNNAIKLIAHFGGMEVIQMSDIEGNTPLHFAAKNGHLDLCELIIMNIKNKNPRNMLNETPMFLAAVNYHNAVCDLFLKRP